MRETLASLVLKLAQIRAVLEERHARGALDAMGAKILHDARNLLVLLDPPPGMPARSLGPDQLRTAVNATTELAETFRQWDAGSAFDEVLFTDRNTPAPETLRAILDAQRGPDDADRDRPTMVPCARCGSCPVCEGTQLATVDENGAWLTSPEAAAAMAARRGRKA